MSRFFVLQLKRLARSLPGVLLVLALLLGGLLTVFSALLQEESSAEENQKIRIAMVGTAEDTMLQLGLSVLQTFDSTQLAMELVELSESEARSQLSAGAIAAYVVIPEGFAQEAMDGTILPLRFVTTTGAAGLVSVFKDEVTRVISQLLLQSQKGVYGMQSAMRDEKIGGRGDQMTNLAIEYVQMILARDKLYTLEELGISDALGLGEYLLCGLGVLLLLLGCLPFAPKMIHRDHALGRVLASRGKPAALQALAEFAAYGLCLLLLAAVLLLAAALLGVGLPRELPLTLLPVVLLAAAYSFCLYGLGGDLISGVLLQFFLTVALCFLSGCLYPVYFFPVAVQKAARLLPTGLARHHLASLFGGSGALGGVLLYSVLFLAAGVGLRVWKIREAKV